MTDFQVGLDELPKEFAVFPLTGALLLPGGRLPLNIFEPRYLAMVEDSLANGRMFGMVQPDKRLARGDTGPGLYRTGCLGRISSFSETDDGRFLITLAGLIRFSIVEEIEMQSGYRRVRGAFAGFAHDLTATTSNDDAAPILNRPVLLAALRRYFAHTGVDANWDAIETMPDHALVVTLCMACPFDAEEKQALLEARDAQQRAQALLALLEINAFDSGHDNDSKAS
ncbi:MAG TPA: LON peptidase substrate-binding domain-containing protein [Acidocella sp.]|nr:LON peptidase substrate-binding domain-containing protein [Acidocella sp.]